MTSECRGLSRRLNGSIETRSVANSWRAPSPSSITPSRAVRVSKARGQSFSVPSSSPTRCFVVSGWPMSVME